MPSATSTKSVQRARQRLTKFLKELDTVPLQELEKTAQAVKEKAIAQAPYRTGKLEKSIYVRVSRDKRRPGLVAGASAKDRGYDYAGIQHEATHFNHPIKGKDHYISDPFNQEVKNLKRRLRRKLKVKKNGS